MTPKERYIELDQKLLEIRLKNGPMDSQEEDDLLDEMDFAWWDMSIEEQDEVDTPERSAKFWGELLKNPEWKKFFEDKKQKGES